MSLKSCIKAGINLSDEDVDAVLANYDAYIKTMSQKEATALAVDDALESALQDKADTLHQIYEAHPDLAPPKFDESQLPSLFDIREDTTMASMDEIEGRGTESPQASVDKAVQYMHEAVVSGGAPRQPLTAWKVTKPNGKSYYSIRDGNTTLQLLKQHGIKKVPLRVEREVTEANLTPVGEHGYAKTNIVLNGETASIMSPQEVSDIADEMKEAQKGWGFEETYAQASENQAYLNTVGESISRMVDATYIRMESGPESVHGEKKKDSAKLKINGKYKGDASKMTDIVRGTFSVMHPRDVPVIIKNLSKRFKGVDEGFQINDSNYFDRKVLVQFDNGQVGEIQIVSPHLYWFKETGGGHETYKILQNEASVFDKATGQKRTKAGWDWIEQVALNTMAQGYARNIGSEEDQAWVDVYEDVVRESRLSTQSSKAAIEIARESSKAQKTSIGSQRYEPSTDLNTAAPPVPSGASKPTQGILSNINERTGLPRDDGKSNIVASYIENLKNHKIIKNGKQVDGYDADLRVQAGDFVQRKPTQPKSPPKVGMHVGAVWNVIRRWQENMPQLAKVSVNVFETQDEAFGEGSVERDGVIQGGFFVGSNELVLIGRNIRDSRELQSVLRHELIGHFGMRELLNKEGRYDKLMQRVWNARNGEFREEAKWVARNYPDMDRKIKRHGAWSDIVQFADEMVARATEAKPQPVGLLKRIHDQIIKWLNQLGLSNGPITQDELKSLIRMSEQNLKHRMVVEMGGPPNDELARIEYEMYLEFEEGVPMSFKEWNARVGPNTEYSRALAKGLEMDFESRMQRAREQGYDTSRVWYHGTNSGVILDRNQLTMPDPYANDFESFQYTRGRTFTMVTAEPRFASLFTGVDMTLTKNLTAKHTGARVIPLLAKTEKTFDYDALNVIQANYGRNPAKDLSDTLQSYFRVAIKKQFKSRGHTDTSFKAVEAEAKKMVARVTAGDWGAIEGPIMQEWLKSKGYDSFYVMEGGQKNLGVMNPNQLRSVNAAFDPDHIGESTMLARRSTGEENDIEKGSPMDVYRREQQKRPIVGNIMEPIRNKDGEYRRNAAGDITGAPEDVKTQQAVDNITTVNVVHMESEAAMMPMSAEWYPDSGAAIREISHGDPVLTEKMVRIMAVLSAANQVGGNVTGAIKAAYQLANGEKLAAGRFPNDFREAMPAILAAKDMNFNLPKVEAKVMSFYRNLWDATFQSDKYEGAVTMDMWMARLYGYKTDTFGPAQYRFASMVTKNIADAYNAKHGTTLTPDQVQAVLWVYARNTQVDEETGEITPFKSTGSFDDYINRAMQSITVEAVPSVDSGLFPEIHNLPFEQKQEYTRQAIGLILNTSGENELFERIGIPLYTDTFSEGTFEEAVNPNAILGVVSKKHDVLGKEPKITERVENRTAKTKLGPFPAKNKRTRVAGPPESKTIPSYQEADLASKALQYIYTQDMVPWFQLDPTLTGANRGVSVEFSERPSVEVEEAFLAHLSDTISADFTRVGNSFLLVNYSDISTKQFIAAVEDAVHEYREIGGAGSKLMTGTKTDVKAKGSENYKTITTDWKNEAAAIAEIEEYFSEAGRSDLLPFLRDRRQAVRQLQESFSQDVAPRFDVAKMAARRVGEAPPYDPRDPNFRASQQAQRTNDAPVGTSLGMPDETLTDWFVRQAQDNFNRVKRMQKSIVEQGGTVELKSDVYGAEERSSSKITSRLKQLKRTYMDPLLDIMDGKNSINKKISQPDLDLYLIAKHANERNEYVASINPQMQDGGSGMMTDEADAILADFEDRLPAFEEAAALVYAMSKENLDNMVDAGLIEQEVVDGWRDRWAYYVPLKGKEGEEQQAGTGKGFSVSGAGVQKVMGRGTGNMPESPVAHAFADAESTIVRAEKTAVGQALVELIRANPDADFWTITERTYKTFEDLFGQPFHGYPEDERPVGLTENTDYRRVWGVTPAEARAAKEEGRPAKKQVYWALDRGYKNRDDVFSVMVDGKELLVNIKDPILREQLKKMNTTQLNAVVRGFGMVNRYLAMINTALNPEFVITNFERDFSTAMINLGGEHSAAIAARVAKGIPSAIRGIWQSTFETSGTSPWRALFDEMEAEGGTIGFFGLEDIDTKVKKIQKKVERKDTILGATMRGIEHVRDVVLDANLSVENAARLSAYKVVKEEGLANGMTEADARANAASVAKNLTVNFNRKGELAPVLNSAYLFFNATIQGSARIFTAMSHPRVRKIVAGVAATSFALALFNRGAGGDDDDGIPYYDKISDYKKQTSMIIMKPDGSGEYWSIRLPYGYNLFWYSGVAMHDLMFNPRMTVPRTGMNMVTTALNAFNPIQGADFLDTITPTFLKPFEQHAQNINFMEGQIKPEYPFDNYDRPDSQKSFKSTNPQLKEMMAAMNELTGGDTTHSGLIDFSPEIVKHYVSWLTGGAGMTAARTVGTVTNLVQGEPIEQKNVPFARQVGGKVGTRFDSERFYDAVKEINAVEAGLKQRAGTPEWRDYQQKYRETHKLSLKMKGVKKRIKRLRDQRDAAYTAEDTEKANEIREEIRQHQMKFSLAFEDAQTTDAENR